MFGKNSRRISTLEVLVDCLKSELKRLETEVDTLRVQSDCDHEELILFTWDFDAKKAVQCKHCHKSFPSKTEADVRASQLAAKQRQMKALQDEINGLADK